MQIDKIVCVGKNYREHALELGDAVPEKPVLFLKPPSVLAQATHWGEQLNARFPEDSAVQPECEIVLCLAKDGFKMTLEQATDAIASVTLGLDMTLRTLQTSLKKQGHPWTTSKVFADAAIIGPWIAIDDFTNFMDAEFYLTIDGVTRQRAVGKKMMMHPTELLIHISHFFPLKAGDIIFTGTPEGVSSIASGSTAVLNWENFQFSVTWI